MRPDLKPAPTDHRAALIAAAVVVLVLEKFVPYGQLILYPFTLLSTWVHEMGHGVTALLCGGQFKKLEIFGNASGLAYTAVVPGWRQAVTAAGGLLAPPLVGALILALARRGARAILWLLAGALFISLLVWVRSQVGWLAMAPLLVLVVLVARYGGPDGRTFFAQLIGVLLGLDTVARIDYLFVRSAQIGGAERSSDVAGIQSAVGGPIWFWGGLIAGISLIFLVLGLWAAWRAPRPRRTAAI